MTVDEAKRTIAAAKRQLTHALEMADKYEFGTYGHRDAINKNIPDAVEAIVNAVFAYKGAMLQDLLDQKFAELIRKIDALDLGLPQRPEQK